MIGQEENLAMILEFLEKGECRVLIVFSSPQGQFTLSTTFPTSTKNKVTYNEAPLI